MAMSKADVEAWLASKNVVSTIEEAVNEAIINAKDAAGINSEYSKRLRSLVSVDDIVEAVCAFLDSKGELERTWIFYTSE